MILKYVKIFLFLLNLEDSGYVANSVNRNRDVLHI